MAERCLPKRIAPAVTRHGQDAHARALGTGVLSVSSPHRQEGEDFFLPVGKLENFPLTTYLVLELVLGVGKARFMRRLGNRERVAHPTMCMKTQGLMQNSGNSCELHIAEFKVLIRLRRDGHRK